MSTYFSGFSSNLETYTNVNDVCSLDTTSFQDGTQVLVIGQGLFKWCLNYDTIPSGSFIFPATYGAGWIKDNSPILLLKDDGTLDTSQLPQRAPTYYYPFLFVVKEVTYNQLGGSNTITITVPGATPESLVFLSCGTPNNTGASLIPINVVPGNGIVTVTFNTATASSHTLVYNCIVMNPS